MSKRIRFFLLWIFCLVFLNMQHLHVSAYTQEEKQMVKDWLSAHGYAPNWDGADQAYQDFLDGKIDLSEYGIYPPSNPETEEDSKDKTNKPEDKNDKLKKNPFADNDTETDARSQPSSQETSSSQETAPQEESSSGDVQEGSAIISSGEEAVSAPIPESDALSGHQTDEESRSMESGEADSPKTADTSQEAVPEASDTEMTILHWILLAIGILFVAAIGSFLYLLKSRKNL